MIGLPKSIAVLSSDGLFGTNGLTVTVKPHEPLLFAESVASHLTVVAPTGKLDPAGGEQVIVTPAGLPPSVGAG